MTVEDIRDWIDSFAPFSTQETFDNAGLLIGNPKAEVRRVLFALDATLPVVREAAEWNANLIVTHHPLMFGGIKAIRYDQPEGEVIAAIASEGINLIAAHTNLDQAVGGTGDSLAATIGLLNTEPTAENPYLRSGTLPAPQSAASFLKDLDRCLNAHARMYGNPEAPVQRITVGAGAIGGEFSLAAADGAQAFVVGEIKHHEILAAQALGIVVYEAGHYETEYPGISALYQRFQSAVSEHQWPLQARLTTIKPYDCATAQAAE